jgi:UDP-N-acetylglucosamine--N-acetylmuramyl-(pentapeptide) pyrophosphoryl-undecaprenol N-acetylglucosamine transferase
MIPLPGQLEQRRNAEAMQEAGAARMIPQEELTGERLAREVGALVEDPERVARMGEAARRLARGDAAVAAVDLLESLVGRRQGKEGRRQKAVGSQRQG